MTDIYTLRVLKSHGYSEDDAEELFSETLNGIGFSDIESVYKWAALTFLTENKIYPGEFAMKGFTPAPVQQRSSVMCLSSLRVLVRPRLLVS
jgi:hypothetical protein